MPQNTKPKVIRLPEKKEAKLFQAQFDHIRKLQAKKELLSAFCVYEVEGSIYFFAMGSGDLTKLLGTLEYVKMSVFNDQVDLEDVVIQ